MANLRPVPSVLVPLCLLLVHYHPQPVDDCPCFEDAIAFVSVILGVYLARWHSVYAGLDERFFDMIMPGGQGDLWTWDERMRWWSLAGAKVGLGASRRPLHHTLPHLVLFLSRTQNTDTMIMTMTMASNNRHPNHIHLATARKIVFTRCPSPRLSCLGAAF